LYKKGDRENSNLPLKKKWRSPHHPTKRRQGRKRRESRTRSHALVGGDGWPFWKKKIETKAEPREVLRKKGKRSKDKKRRQAKGHKG